MRFDLFKAIAVTSVVASVAVAPWYGCAGTALKSVRLDSLKVTVPTAVKISVWCGDELAYSVEASPKEPLIIGGPEVLCAFVPDTPVAVEVEPVFEQETIE